MQTITFYSYKGGVGRTLTLANTAAYLSKFGLNVCILDFDLEAPGLHYKFDIHSKDIEKGIVDFIYDFVDTNSVNENIEEYAIDVKASGKGKVSIIPAGNVLDGLYWQKMSKIDIHELIRRENNEGILFFLELKEKIKNEIQPDFLLIDSRTGVTEIGGVSTSLLADKIVFLLANNEENLDGTTQILRSINSLEQLPGEEKVETTFVLTRIPLMDEKRDELEKEVKEKLLKSFHQVTNTIKEDDIVIIHSNRQIELNEFLAVNENNEEDNSTLLNDYLGLISKVIPDEMIAPNLNIRIKDIRSQIFDNTDKVQKDLESLAKHFRHKITFENLLKFYLVRNLEDKFISEYNKFFEKYSSIKIGRGLQEHYSNLFLDYAKNGKDTSKFNRNICYKYAKGTTVKSNIFFLNFVEYLIKNDKFYFELPFLRRELNFIINKSSDNKHTIQFINKLYQIDTLINIENLEVFKDTFRKHVNIIIKEHELLTKYLSLIYNNIEVSLLSKTLTDKYIAHLSTNNLRFLSEIFVQLENEEELIPYLNAELKDLDKFKTEDLEYFGRIYDKLGIFQDFEILLFGSNFMIEKNNNEFYITEFPF